MAEKQKTCFKCGDTKELSSFYRHPAMADGHVNKCKECNKRDVRENRKHKVDYYREYDRARGNRQTRSYTKEYYLKYPGKLRAHRLTNYHIRKGNLVAKPCEKCGSEQSIHAHHDDYSRPLDVRWLCAIHHKEWHIENGEAPNG